MRSSKAIAPPSTGVTEGQRISARAMSTGSLIGSAWHGYGRTAISVRARSRTEAVGAARTRPRAEVDERPEHEDQRREITGERRPHGIVRRRHPVAETGENNRAAAIEQKKPAGAVAVMQTLGHERGEHPHAEQEREEHEPNVRPASAARGEQVGAEHHEPRADKGECEQPGPEAPAPDAPVEAEK